MNLHGYFPFAPTRPAAKHGSAVRDEMRRQVLVAAGLWPMPEKTPGAPVIHGRVDRDGYTVEKVYFESYPGFFVTGSLYRPKSRPGKLPAVLCPHGHWPAGRFHDSGAAQVRLDITQGAERFEQGGRHPVQARCVQLARMGCVVFLYDMVGYADSKQLSHRPGDRSATEVAGRWAICSVHRPRNSTANQFLVCKPTTSIRALDFVASLPGCRSNGASP